MTDNQMTCAECDEMFLDYFEGTLDGQSRSRFNDHATTCLRCQALIRDIDGIRDQAAALPEIAPSRDLWSGIEARIQPEVRSIVRPNAAPMSKRWLAAAAAALIVATSSVTYLATSRAVNQQPVAGVKAPTIIEQPAVAMAPASPAASSTEIPSAVAVTPNTSTAVVTRSPGRGGIQSIEGKSTARMSLVNAAAPSASEVAFSGEINQLQSVLVERRSQLDPETVKVVEDNLKLIDTAVKRARSALLKDPASGFLTRQLDNALQKKVELLRTVALLPAST